MIELLFMALWQFTINGEVVDMDLAGFEVNFVDKTVLLVPDLIFKGGFE